MELRCIGLGDLSLGPVPVRLLVGGHRCDRAPWLVGTDIISPVLKP